jgi:hypothetical protein
MPRIQGSSTLWHPTNESQEALEGARKARNKGKTNLELRTLKNLDPLIEKDSYLSRYKFYEHEVNWVGK